MGNFDHWRNYEMIDRVATLDANNAGPDMAAMQVIANTHPSSAYPEYRIVIVIGELGSVMLTPAQSAELRAHLERAEADVALGAGGAAEPDDATAAPPVTAATGELCSRVIAAGEFVHECEDATVHAGTCPGGERARG